MIKKYILAMWLALSSLGLYADIDANYEFKGRHFVASYLSCDRDRISNIEELKKAFLAAVNASGATVLDTADYVFAPDGLTMVVLLSESHASIHTYPEHNACFIDLFTCGSSCDAAKFDEALQEYLKPEIILSTLFDRSQNGVVDIE